jgi:hypothetical protein
MRTLIGILTVAAFAMTVGSAANANVVVTLTQVGGTYNSVVGAQFGDTLILDVGYDITGASDNITLIDPAIAFPTNVATFVTGYETGLAMWSNGSIPLNTIGPPGGVFTVLNSGGTTWIDGWEKADITFVGANPPCISGACSSLGTITLQLTGVGGVIDTGLILQPSPGGTTIQSGLGVDVTGLASLGTFYVVPEPTTASLLGLGLLGLCAASRRRKNARGKRPI